MFYDCIKEEPEEDEESTYGALLNINVRFLGGHTKTLSIYENDIIEEKVDKFCLKHSLNEKVKEMLTNQVITQLDNQIIECKNFNILIYIVEQSQKNTDSSNHSSINLNDQSENQSQHYLGDSHHQQHQHQHHNNTEGNNINRPSNVIKAEVKEITYTTNPKIDNILIMNNNNNQQANRKKSNKNGDNSHMSTKTNSISHIQSQSKSKSKSKPKESIDKITSKPQIKKISIPNIKPNQSKTNNNTNINNTNIKTIKLPIKRVVNSPLPNSRGSKPHPLSPLPNGNNSFIKSNSHKSLTPTKKQVTKNRNEIKGNQVKQSSKNKNIKKVYDNKSLEVIQMKIIKYKEIFDILDSDKDGMISSKNINLSIISKELLKAFTPILGELQKTRMNMSFKEFCIRVDKILSVKYCNETEF